MSDKRMTWHETIEYIRTQAEYKDLVEKAYFEADLPLNVERFRQSEEFIETLKILREYQPQAKTILDIGSGNGISAVALSLAGYQVHTIEPDPSMTIGAGAIRQLKTHYGLKNLEIYEAFAEEIKFPDNNFDIVYARQCMHHAYDLEKFVQEASRVLKKKGLFLTVRDHIIFDEADKKWFLECHPLQKFYGGENAFTSSQYQNAMQNVGLKVKKELKFYDNVINYFPIKSQEIKEKLAQIYQERKKSLKRKLGVLVNMPLIYQIYDLYLDTKYGKSLDEKQTPGRMYSYIALKK